MSTATLGRAIFAGAETPAARNQMPHQSSVGSIRTWSRSAAGEVGPSLARQVGRARHRREDLIEEAMAGQPRPVAAARADGHIDAVAGEVGEAGRDLDPHGQFGMRQLEAPDARRQPVAGNGLHGRDGQHVPGRLARLAEAAGEIGQRLAHHRIDLAAALGQVHAARPAQEEGAAHMLLQQLHLIADGRLGHVQFGRGAGQVAMTGNGLEDADGGQGRQVGHELSHQLD